MRQTESAIHGKAFAACSRDTANCVLTNSTTLPAETPRSRSGGRCALPKNSYSAPSQSTNSGMRLPTIYQRNAQHLSTALFAISRQRICALSTNTSESSKIPARSYCPSPITPQSPRIDSRFLRPGIVLLTHFRRNHMHILISFRVRSKAGRTYFG